MNKELLTGASLRIGDVVEQVDGTGTPFNGAYTRMTVINKTETEITFFRPYVSLANFTYTGGVIPYVGISQFNAPIEHPMKYILIENIYRGT